MRIKVGQGIRREAHDRKGISGRRVLKATCSTLDSDLLWTV